ncbi:Putative protein in type-1 retrotransposable element R1DM [Araneus ventricosus]|uniref:ribonuclease H n=1 Tax=Araneus ventricosus TaxID=182803 RepID=A0A4Y2B3S9_ARAVE|nr:Putative protein in type-1 retrotransposable element R1DM [Araneus ventricosus]
MDSLILEISHLGLNGSLDLLVGDFNARSQIWGYGFEDRRGRIMSEFIATNNFSVCNRTDLGPTFVTDKAQGFPDISLLSAALQDLFDSWLILNKESLSDHKASREGSDVALVSIDIRAASDSLDWEVLFSLFHKYNFPFGFRSFIHSLTEQSPTELAYADDLALVVSASSRKILEDSASSFLDVLNNFLEELNLQIVSEKTLAVVFRGTQNKNRQKRGLAVLKRLPIFKIGGRTIRTVDSLKYLGIYIDNLLNWSDHLSFLHSKIHDLIKNFSSVSGPNWGTSVSLLKHWYLSVIQPSLLYGAAVWGGSFTKKQINTLHSIQRVALIKISKSFRTCPTDALNVFLGLPPLHVVANSLFIKFKIWHARCNDFDFINTNNLDFYIKINNLDLNHRVIEFPNCIPNADFDVYTDGSGIDGNIGASVCIFKNNARINSFRFKLNNYNSVFQAELAAINFAAGWAVENSYKINIFTDSFSSIEVLKKANSKSNYINIIKSNMFKVIGSVGLSWVKAHPGIPGNELADQLAKGATTDGVLLSLPAPYSFLKKFINSNISGRWQRHWGKLKMELESESLSHLWTQLF